MGRIRIMWTPSGAYDSALRKWGFPNLVIALVCIGLITMSGLMTASANMNGDADPLLPALVTPSAAIKGMPNPLTVPQAKKSMLLIAVQKNNKLVKAQDLNFNLQEVSESNPSA